MNRDATQQSFGDAQRVVPFVGYVPQHAHGLTRHFRANAVAG
jgi:hypothetical protein